MSIKAIFFSKFDTQEGPKVVHQVPDGAINSTVSPSQNPLLNFSDISFFVIPRQELCGNLIQVCKEGYRIVGYPVCIPSPRYDRNEFIFNFCIVLAEEEEFSTYKSVVQKLADLMKGLEEQSGFLSRDFSKGGEGKVYALCEMLMEDLNNYCECMIPIDDLNTLNIKLFPTYPPPPPVKAWHVPLFTVRPETLMDENWDITMQRIIPHINGISSVHQIAILADADLSLTRRCIKHLLYYGCLLLLDIFSFSAIYAPTAQFATTIAGDAEMQRECARYVNTAFAPAYSSAPVPPKEISIWPAYEGEDPQSLPHHSVEDPSAVTTTAAMTTNGAPTGAPKLVDGVAIVGLYAAMRQGLSVRQWYKEHSPQLANVDIRRFVTFGIIKGFLYRVHKYAYATAVPTISPSTTHGGSSATRNGNTPAITTGPPSFDSSVTHNQNHNTLHVPSHHQYHHRPQRSTSAIDPPVVAADDEDQQQHSEDEDILGSSFPNDVDEGGGIIDDKVLAKYLDGTHCFDQICTELEVSERELTARLRRWPTEVQIIHR